MPSRSVNCERSLIRLRQSTATRRPLSEGVDRRSRIPEVVGIHGRPLEIEGWLRKGHGDLIKGKFSSSSVGVLEKYPRG